MAISKFSKFVLGITAIGIGYAIFLIIKNPQPFGKIILIAFIVFGFTVFIKHKIFRSIFQVITLIIGLLFSTLGTRSLLFNQTNGQLLESKTEVVFSELSFLESLSKASKENKLVFVDFYTVWCPPCIKFHKEVLEDKAVAEVMNRSFINIKIDLYNGEGITLKEKYNVYYVPRFLVLDGEGSIIEDISTDTELTRERMINISKKYIKQ